MPEGCAIPARWPRHQTDKELIMLRCRRSSQQPIDAVVYCNSDATKVYRSPRQYRAHSADDLRKRWFESNALRAWFIQTIGTSVFEDACRAFVDSIKCREFAAELAKPPAPGKTPGTSASTGCRKKADLKQELRTVILDAAGKPVCLPGRAGRVVEKKLLAIAVFSVATAADDLLDSCKPGMVIVINPRTAGTVAPERCATLVTLGVLRRYPRRPRRKQLVAYARRYSNLLFAADPACLAVWYDGELDQWTLEIMKPGGPQPARPQLAIPPHPGPIQLPNTAHLDKQRRRAA